MNAKEALKIYFGYDSFKSGQEEIIRAILDGKDVLAIMPPYIIFSDKTLIDMSIKTPTDKAAMLNVSGVGEAKYEKYGERFIEAIAAFIDGHTDAVTSIKDEDSVAESDGSAEISFDSAGHNRRMNRPDGAGASWTEEEDKQLDEEYGSGMKISEIAKVHDRTNGAIRARLKKQGKGCVDPLTGKDTSDLDAGGSDDFFLFLLQDALKWPFMNNKENTMPNWHKVKGADFYENH